jgi:hypothetical protein
MKTTKIIAILILIGIFFIILNTLPPSWDITKCVYQDDAYGFWGGLWHGIISPISFVSSLFNDNVEFYCKNNNGGWYDFGFVLGGGLLFGGGSKRRKE